MLPIETNGLSTVCLQWGTACSTSFFVDRARKPSLEADALLVERRLRRRQARILHGSFENLAQSALDLDSRSQGRRDSNPRPPEIHSEEEPAQIRQNVVFTRCFGHRCRISRPTMAGKS